MAKKCSVVPSIKFSFETGAGTINIKGNACADRDMIALIIRKMIDDKEINEKVMELLSEAKRTVSLELNADIKIDSE